ncbi:MULTISPECIES: hypothetical protein [Streptomyces]|uniref:Integrase n=1 Tax=Streptomyces antibioticus TaxID=1890 RepID=A0AAE6Y5V3_STRAT|nr:hypothetical protein [Streptomyces antibioticus]OOQ55354.1 hypothetical protein AFM16_04970 [Streptomyces antibioticus]QIT42992.1 hypothetical protein HCX60_05175 [Streptomyces antibioticus]
MSRRGRPAQSPEGVHHRPPVLEAASLVVRHVDRQGRVAIFDFASLPVAVPFQRSLAALFVAKCSAGGGWDSVNTSDTAWWMIRPFAYFLGEQPDAPQDIDGLTAALWNTWRLSLEPRTNGSHKHSAVAGLLQQDSRLPQPVREAMARRFAWSAEGERAYLPEEFRTIRTAARRTFRAALLRIRANTATLEQWRTGAVSPGGERWLLGEALDVLARTGDVPQKPLKSGGGMRALYRYRAALGGTGAVHTWKRLFLSRTEAAALGVLFVAEFGLNAATVSGMPVPALVPGSGGQTGLIYRLALEKPRRSGRGRFESRNIADIGADSAGRLLTEALEATTPARTALEAGGSPVDRLMVWHETTPHQGQNYPGTVRTGPFGFGVEDRASKDWARSVGLSGSPMRRMRRTVNVLHRRESGQNSQDTHDRVYVIPEPQAQQAAIPVIAEGALDAWRAAHRTVLLARLTEVPEDGEQETATTGCADYTRSPFTPAGPSCAASFLLCTACPNARVTPAHHARLAYLHQALAGLRGVVEETVWESGWADAHARLEDLRARLGPAVWAAARTGATAEDRAVIDQLLNGDYDL